MTANRLVAGASVLLAVLGVAGFVFEGGALFHRPLVMDEWHTLLVAREGTLSGVLHALSEGADFNPPLLHVWHWFVGAVAGDVTTLQLRLTALASVWLAVAGLFVLLWHATSWVPALTGALLTLAGSEVISQAFEGRFYGPWLMLTVLHVALLTRACARPDSMVIRLAACAAAVLLCLIHYFGILTLTLVTAGALIGSRFARRQAWTPIISYVAGLSAVATVMPLLSAQRAALSLPTWVWPPTLWSATLFIAPGVLVLAAGSVVLRQHLSTRATSDSRRALMGALFSLAFLPLILLVFSLAVQSVVLPRYALPALLSLGPVVAAVTAKAGRPLQAALVVLAFLASLAGARAAAGRGAAFTRRVEADLEAVQLAVRSGDAIAVASPTVLYPLLAKLPSSPLVLGMTTVPPDQIRRRFPEASDSASLGNALIVVQDVAGIDRRLFGLPPIVTVEALSRMPCFYLLELWDTPFFAERWLPGSEATRVRPHLFRIRTPVAAKPDASRDCD